MKTSLIVDTNVPIKANRIDTPQAELDCVLTCIDTLEAIREQNICLLDSEGLILEEYLKQKPHGIPRGPGDSFIVWAIDNQWNPDHCRIVEIHPIEDERRQFEEFPDDLELEKFDLSDRKFVAVVRASGDSPEIVNAADGDWKEFRIPLSRHGVFVRELCER